MTLKGPLQPRGLRFFSVLSSHSLGVKWATLSCTSCRHSLGRSHSPPRLPTACLSSQAPLKHHPPLEVILNLTALLPDGLGAPPPNSILHPQQHKHLKNDCHAPGPWAPVPKTRSSPEQVLKPIPPTRDHTSPVKPKLHCGIPRKDQMYNDCIPVLGNC